MNTYSMAQAVKFFRPASFIFVAVNFALFYISSTYAQISAGPSAPPPTSVVDAAGVDLMSGARRFALKDLSIGSGVSTLTHEISTDRTFFFGFYDNFTFQIHPYANTEARMKASVGNSSQDFSTVSDGTPWRMPSTPVNNNGATLEKNPSTGAYRYTKNDGTVVSYNYDGDGLKITYPNGFQILKNKSSVTTNTGLQFKYLFAVNDSSATGYSKILYSNPNKIIAINNAYEYCSRTSTTCALNITWPSVTYEWPTEVEHNNQNGNFSVIDANNVKTIYTHKSYSIDGDGDPSEPLIYRVFSGANPSTPLEEFEYTGVETTGATYSIGSNGGYSTAAILPTYTYSRSSDGSIIVTEGSMALGGPIDGAEAWFMITLLEQVKTNVVAKVTRPDGVWNYRYPTPPALYAWKEGVGTGPMGTHHVFMSSTGSPHSDIVNIDMPDGTHADFNPKPINEPHTVTSKGKKYTYEYDKRGNLIKSTQHAAEGSPEAGSVKQMEAYYPNPDSITCTNLKTCNKPTWVRDAKGNQTDYTYYEEHGGIKTVTLPADAKGKRATTWYKYAQKYAWYKKNSNTLERADTPVWLLTEELSCTEGAANPESNTCVDSTAKLVIKRYDYGVDGVPNNLWIKGEEVIADGKTLRTCYQYDYYGNVIAETQPKAGLSSCQ